MHSIRSRRVLMPLALALGCIAVLGASPRPPESPHPAAAPSPAATAPATSAPAASNPLAGGLESKDYRIETDETHWNFNSGDFTMPHHVKFYRPGTDAVSDKATGNSKRGTATLIGNVVVHDSGNAPEASTESYHGNGPATLTCDRLEIDTKQKIYTATGHVHFSQGARTGTADRGQLNRGTGVLHLEGNVKLTEGDQSMAAQDLVYNLNTRDVDVHGAPIIIKQPVPSPTPGAPATPKPKKRK
jgi:lipopolysaccharide export system protein LptA